MAAWLWRQPLLRTLCWVLAVWNLLDTAIFAVLVLYAPFLVAAVGLGAVGLVLLPQLWRTRPPSLLVPDDPPGVGDESP